MAAPTTPIVNFVRALPVPLRRHKVVSLLWHLFPRWRIATFNFNGSATITADLADTAARAVVIMGGFEHEFFDIVSPFLLPDSAVLDVGANHGFCTFGLAAQTSPQSHVSFHLFEANRHLSEMLALSRAHYHEHSIRVNTACVSDQPGTSTLHIVDGHWGGSFISEDPGGQSVDNVVLDAYIADNVRSLVSVLKIDIEGYEKHALLGAANSIQSGLIGAIYIEVSADNLQRQGSTPEEVIRLLQDLGCCCFWCKSVDFQSGIAEEWRSVVPQEGCPPIKLAPVKSFPAGHQTDLIAIHKEGPFAHILKAFG